MVIDVIVSNCQVTESLCIMFPTGALHPTQPGVVHPRGPGADGQGGPEHCGVHSPSQQQRGHFYTYIFSEIIHMPKSLVNFNMFLFVLQATTRKRVASKPAQGQQQVCHNYQIIAEILFQL